MVYVFFFNCTINFKSDTKINFNVAKTPHYYFVYVLSRIVLGKCG